MKFSNIKESIDSYFSWHKYVFRTFTSTHPSLKVLKKLYEDCLKSEGHSLERQLAKEEIFHLHNEYLWKYKPDPKSFAGLIINHLRALEIERLGLVGNIERFNLIVPILTAVYEGGHLTQTLLVQIARAKEIDIMITLSLRHMAPHLWTEQNIIALIDRKTIVQAQPPQSNETSSTISCAAGSHSIFKMQHDVEIEHSVSVAPPGGIRVH